MKPVPIRDLKRGDKVRCTVTNTKTGESRDENLTYAGMDGMYARLLDKNNDIINARGYLEKKGDHYEFVKEKGEESID